MLLYGKYDGDYWLLIEMKETATLEELDRFIRDIWVECCGHLSAFNIEGTCYEPCMDGEDDWYGASEEDMSCMLKDVLHQGLVMGYQYDFGSTTELVIKVLGHGAGAVNGDAVTILSRNIPPEIFCSKCGRRPAEWISPWRYYEADAFRCGKCLEEEEEQNPDSEEWYLPVCNSPRMGVCGYEGSSIYPDVFLPDKKA